MKKYRVFIDGIEAEVMSARVSAAPINRVWTGVQRNTAQSEEAYFVSFNMTDKTDVEIELDGDFESYEIRPPLISKTGGTEEKSA